MSLHAAMQDACRAVGILPPRRHPVPGRWTPCPVDGKAASNTSGRVLVADDGRSGVAWNHVTGQHVRFTVDGPAGDVPPALRRDPEADRRREAERLEAERICAAILRTARAEPHPYLARKGFPDEVGLVHDHPSDLCSDTPAGRDIAAAIPQGLGPLLIVPGRIGRDVVTVQFIAADGTKKNILHGRMSGACHRIATGTETWVCEGIATALSVRAALRLLGRPATVLCAFAANNVEKVARGIPGSVIAADHDKPQPTLGDMGAGEYYARRSGRLWVMPPELGDFNDMHQAHGLRAVALALREVRT